MLYEVITLPLPPHPGGLRQPLRLQLDPRDVRCRRRLPGSTVPERSRPLLHPELRVLRQPLGTGTQSRITSYNVCYTKLLRFFIDDGKVMAVLPLGLIVIVHGNFSGGLILIPAKDPFPVVGEITAELVAVLVK